MYLYEMNYTYVYMNDARGLVKYKLYVCMQGLCIYATQSVVPEYSILKGIVHCAGGKVCSLQAF